MRYAHGWYCVAFESELTGPLHPATIGDRRLILVRSPAGLAAHDADCPHRGAHLALGKLEHGHVICPYHGYRIRLGAGTGLAVRGYETMLFGGAIYVRLSGERDNGWVALTSRLADSYRIAPGLRIDLHAPMEAVIENAFDRLHFHAVHRLGSAPFEVAPDAAGALTVHSRFRAPGSGDIPYQATTISPGLTFVWLGGDAPYGIVTGTTPTAPDRCTARLTYVIPRSNENEEARLLADLDAYSRQGLGDDDRIWRFVSPSAPVRWTDDDAPIRRFYDFCAEFEGPVRSIA